ncbi:MAG TPA: hypothetical protein VK672_05215 [Solirubrobacteraceae bacterium]|jgi:hypothetical protein|nr:hypothetical protein [Solirubrobacteraceae bacterium]
MTDVEREEEMILGRLVAIRELRQATHRLESRGRGVPASDVMLPAGWLHLLDRGLAMATEDAEEECADGKLSDDENRERVERARWLTMAIRGVKPGSAYPVSPAYHDALLEGLRYALSVQHFDTKRMSEHDPIGLRFIASHSLYALYEFITALEDSVDEASVEIEYE